MGGSLLRVEYEDINRGATVLVRRIDGATGVDTCWIEPLMFGWRRAIIELDQIRSLILVRLNETLQRVYVINPQLSKMVKDKVKFAITYMNRNVDAFLTKRMVVCGFDSMDQIIVDSTLRRLHYQINLMRIALNQLGDPQANVIGITHSSRPLLYLTEKHISCSATPTLVANTTTSFHHQKMQPLITTATFQPHPIYMQPSPPPLPPNSEVVASPGRRTKRVHELSYNGGSVHGASATGGALASLCPPPSHPPSSRRRLQLPLLPHPMEHVLGKREFSHQATAPTPLENSPQHHKPSAAEHAMMPPSPTH